MSEIKKAPRIEPLSNVVCIWLGDHGGHPDGVKIAFMDGSIQQFWRNPQQPAPQTGYVGKHIKRAGERYQHSTGKTRNESC